MLGRFITKSGQAVVLRYPTLHDVKIATDYINEVSKENTFLTFSGEQLTEDEERKYIDDSLLKIEKGDMVKIYCFKESELIAEGSVERDFRTRKRGLHRAMLGVSVKKEYRGLGHGKRIIDWFINDTPRTATLYARCLAESQIMCCLLLNKGFSVLSESQSGTKTLELKSSNKPSYSNSNTKITKESEMNSDLPGSASNLFSPEKLYFIGQFMYWLAHVMTIFGVIGMAVRKVAHTSLETLQFPTFWVPESFAGALFTAMLYLFGFGLCWFIKGIERDLRR